MISRKRSERGEGERDTYTSPVDDNQLTKSTRIPGKCSMTFLKKVFGQSGGDKRFKEVADSNSSNSITSGSEPRVNPTPPPPPPPPLGSLTQSPPPSKPFSTAVDTLIPQQRPQYLFGDFEVTRTLGTGSFGRVCLALHRPTGQYYAMKKLRKSDVLRLKQVEHTNNERFLLSQVDHPFIVKMACTFQDERHLYIMLEYICGGELFTLLRKVRV